MFKQLHRDFYQTCKEKFMTVQSYSSKKILVKQGKECKKPKTLQEIRIIWTQNPKQQQKRKAEQNLLSMNIITVKIKADSKKQINNTA